MEETHVTTVIGIDPGFEGGIAFLSGNQTRELPWLAVVAMPVIESQGTPRKGKKTRLVREYDEMVLRDIILRHTENASVAAFIEKQQPMMRYDPNRWNDQAKKMGMNVPPSMQAVWNLCYGYALIRGVLIGLQIPTYTVPPKTWQAKMLGGMDRKDTKAASIRTARQMYPLADFRKSERCRNLHDGMTDAALIATYGWQTVLGGATGWTPKRIFSND